MSNENEVSEGSGGRGEEEEEEDLNSLGDVPGVDLISNRL